MSDIAEIPELEATATDSSIPDAVASAQRRVTLVRDWSRDGAVPTDWEGDAADAAAHEMTRFAGQGDGTVVRLASAHAAFSDYLDALILLRSDRVDLVTWRSEVSAAWSDVMIELQSNPLYQDPVIHGPALLSVQQQIQLFNTGVTSWVRRKSEAEQALVTALGQSLPTTPDHLVGLDSSYLTAQEGADVIDALLIDPTDAEALAMLERLTAQYGDDEVAWAALYDELGPERTTMIFGSLSASYPGADGDQQAEILQRAEGLRNGFALATTSWSDLENAQYAQSLIDIAAADENDVPAVAYLFSAAPTGGTDLSGPFSLAAAETVYAYETGQPPVRITSGPFGESALYLAATGADPNHPGVTTEIDLAGPVLQSLANSPEHSLEHLSLPGRSEHWLTNHWWEADGHTGITAVYDSALSAPGGVSYPPPTDGPAYDPEVAADQAQLYADFFEHFGHPEPHPETLTDQAMASLGSISARAMPFASWVFTQQTDTSSDYVFLGLEQYRGAEIPTLHVDDVSRVLGIGIEDDSFTQAFSDRSGAYQSAVLHGMDDGTIAATDGMDSIVASVAFVDGMNERLNVDAAVSEDRVTGLVVSSAGLLPKVGPVFGGIGAAGAALEFLDIASSNEANAREQARLNLIGQLDEIQTEYGGSLTAEEIEDLRIRYTAVYYSILQ